MLHAGTDRDSEVRLESLTAREREVALLIAGGLTYQQIADRLSISYHTVNAHMKAILRKTDAGNGRRLAAIVCDATRGDGTQVRHRSADKPTEDRSISVAT